MMLIKNKKVKLFLITFLLLGILYGSVIPPVQVVFADNNPEAVDGGDMVEVDPAEADPVDDAPADGEADGDASVNDDPDDDDTVQAEVASPGNTSGNTPAQAAPAAIGQIGTFGGPIPASDITWNSVVLMGTKSNGDTEIISNNSTGFDFGQYVSLTLSLKWRATDQSRTFDTGNYFTFPVPNVFDTGSDPANYIPMTSGSLTWGTIKIVNGGATATFNNNIKDREQVSGSINLEVSIADLSGSTINWTFTIGGTPYSYAGTVPGAGVGPGTAYKGQYKYGEYEKVGGNNSWQVIFNIGCDNFTGNVTVIDTFGGDYQIAPVYGVEGHEDEGCDPNGSTCSIAAEWDECFTPTGYKHACFEIYKVNYTKIRQDYAADGKTLDPEYDTNDEIDNNYLWKDDPPGSWDYKYLEAYDGNLTAEITDEGIKLVFDGAKISGYGILIQYWYDLSSIRPVTSVANEVVISTTTTPDYASAAYRTFGLGSRADVTGVSGKIALYKQNPTRSVSFEGVEFLLQKQGSTYSKTATTVADGSLVFDLDKVNGSYAGTYTLIEKRGANSLSGYICGDPITFKVDDDGAIIEINGADVTGRSANTQGLEFDADIGWLSQDGLLMIVYNKAGTPDIGSLTVTKTVAGSGAPLSGAKFKLYYGDDSGNGYYCTVNASGAVTSWTTKAAATELTTDGNGEITVTGLEYGTYYLVETATPAGYQLLTTPIKVVINDDNNVPSINPIVNTPTTASLQLTGTKNLDGRSLGNGEFSFVVKENGSEIVRGSNNAGGVITFAPIQYTAADIRTHTYTVSEDGTANIPGIGYDSAVYTVTVAVSNPSGVLTVGTPVISGGNNGGSITFNNTYTPSPSGVDIRLTGTKNLTVQNGSRTLVAGEFYFVVKDKDNSDAIVARVSNDENGDIAFPPIHCDETTAHTHHYTVSEESGSLSGITYDTGKYEVTVDVDFDGGVLTAGTPVITKNNLPASEIVFTNTYAVPAGDTEITLPGTKNLTGRTLVAGEFNFTVRENGSIIATGTNDANGDITFTSIHGTIGQQHTYIVTEESGSLSGITYDTTVYTVTGYVDASGLVAGTIVISNGSSILGIIVFTNEYSAPVPPVNPPDPPDDTPDVPSRTSSNSSSRSRSNNSSPSVSISLTGTKRLTGKALEDNMFSFAVKDKSGKIVSTGTNSANRKIKFTPIDFTSTGIYIYTVTETVGNLSEITYDKTKYSVTVSVDYNSRGLLTANVTGIYANGSTERKDNIVFTNTYTYANPPATELQIPNTGQDNMLYFWIAGLVAAICFTSVILWINHKKTRVRDNEKKK